MKKWLLFGCALLVVRFVSGDLGLTITIPNLSSSVKSTIGNGIKVITAANASITVNTTLDASGALRTLRTLMNEIVPSIGNLLSGIQNATTNKSGDTDSVANSINAIISDVGSAIATAVEDNFSLGSVTKDVWFNGLIGNLWAITASVNSFSEAFNGVSTLLSDISSAEYPYTSNNVTKVITPAVINSISTPLKYVIGNLTSAGTIITAIGKDKQAAVALKTAANKTMNNDLTRLVSVSASFNKTMTDVQTSIIRLANTSLIAINNTYKDILARKMLYNGGETTNLTSYLALNILTNNSILGNIGLTYSVYQDMVSTALIEETSNIVNALTLGLSNVTDMASTNASKYATSCANKYGSMFQQSTVSMTRLAPCIQQETSGFSSLLQAVQVQFNALIQDGGASALKLNFCTVPNGNCSVSYFASFDVLGDTVATRYSMVFGLLAQPAIIARRIRACIIAVSNDIQDVSSVIQNKFGKCLTTGS
ncbi:uncharacterized protein LOC131430996 [Malaya genurostris]|uniref:uncharacterized protein LOC131430996 n=1 Tax=Malaya genurostris TaxID=325434 RepID=UPI0026F3AC73|nr:uncharacterized protein LOC131430996 [Malaya genurostris]